MPARLQILKFLCKYMIRNCVDDLVAPGRMDVSQTFLLPREIAQAWFWRSVQNKGLVPSPPPTSSKVLFLAIRRGLLKEWATRWSAAPKVAAAKEAFPGVVKNYFIQRPRDRFSFSMFLRFLTSDVYLGTIHLPRDDWYDAVYPICGDDLSREHVLRICPGLAVERDILSRTVPEDRLRDWNWVVRFGEKPVSRFLVAVYRRFADAGSLGVRSTELYEHSSLE